MASTERRDSKLHLTYDEKMPSTEEELREFYDTWADTYDRDYKEFGYEGPRVTAKTLEKYVPDKDAKIIEFGSGTGMVGEQLQMLGFRDVDAVDMSRDSLNTCKKKKFYQSLFCSKIDHNPLDGVKPGTYDALVTCGTFIPDHINQGCFPEMIRVLKTGGYIILVMREEFMWTAAEYTNNQLENAMEAMATEGKWEIVSRKQFPHYFNDKGGIAFVFRKL